MASAKPEAKTSAEDAEQQAQTFVRIQNVTGDEIRVPVDPEKIKTIADLCSWEIIRVLFREDQLRPPAHRLLWLKVREECADGADEGEDQGDDVADEEPRTRSPAADDTEDFLARDAEIEHDSEGVRVLYRLVVTAARDWGNVLREALPLRDPQNENQDEDVSEVNYLRMLSEEDTDIYENYEDAVAEYTHYYENCVRSFVKSVSLDDARDFIYDEAYMTPGLGVVAPNTLRDVVLRAVLCESLPWLTNAPDNGRLRQRGQRCRQEAGVRVLPWKIICAAMELGSEDWALHARAIGERLGVTIEPEDRRSFGKRILERVWWYGLLSDRGVCVRERVLGGESERVLGGENYDASLCAEDAGAALVVATLDTCQLGGESLADVFFSRWALADTRFTFRKEPEPGIPPVTVMEWLHDKMGESEVLAFLGKMEVLLSPDRLVDSCRVDEDPYYRKGYAERDFTYAKDFAYYAEDFDVRRHPRDLLMKMAEEFSDHLTERVEYAIAAIELFLGCASSLGLSRGSCASVVGDLKELDRSLASRAVLESFCGTARSLAARPRALGADAQERRRSYIGCFADIVLGRNGGRAHYLDEMAPKK